MEIQAVKLELMRLILNTNNPNILNEMLSAAKSKKKDFWELLTLEEKNEIEEGFKEIKRGEKISYHDLIKKHK